MHRTHGTRAWVWAVVLALGCVCVHADVCVRGNVAVGNGNYACDMQHVRVTMASMVAAQRADVQLVVNSALHNVRAVVPCVTEYRSEWRVCMGDPVAVGFRFRTGAYVPYVDSLAPGWIRRVLRVSYLLDLVDVWKADTVIDVQTDLWRIDHNISAATRRVPPGYGHLWNTTVDDIRLCKDPALSWPVYVVRDQNEMAALVDVRGENATDLECHVVFAFGGADVRDAEPQRKYAATVPTVAYVLGYQPAVVAWRPVLLTELVHLPFIVAVGCVRAFQIGASALAVCVLPVWRVHVCLLLLYGQRVMCAYTNASYRVRFFVALASVCGVADGYVILGVLCLLCASFVHYRWWAVLCALVMFVNPPLVALVSMPIMVAHVLHTPNTQAIWTWLEGAAICFTCGFLPRVVRAGIAVCAALLMFLAHEPWPRGVPVSAGMGCALLLLLCLLVGNP